MVNVTERAKRWLKQLAATKLRGAGTAPRLVLAGTCIFRLVADRESDGDERVEHDRRVILLRGPPGTRSAAGSRACERPDVTITALPEQRHVGALARTLAAFALVTFVSAGCQSLTGRPAGQYLQDKALQAKVKARLAAASPGTLTRLNVDVYNGTVYLLGVIDDEAEALEVTRLASVDEHPVVSWLEAPAPTAAAAPHTSPADHRRRGSDDQ